MLPKAGEDLTEHDDEEGPTGDLAREEGSTSQRQPLLHHTPQKPRRRSSSVSVRGDATVMQAVFMASLSAGLSMAFPYAFIW